MRLPISILLIASLAACGGSGSGPATPVAVGPPPPSQPTNPTPRPRPGDVDNLGFASQLNGVRAANGAGTVQFDARLANAAQFHADDMLARNYFSHISPEGGSPGDRITAAGYQWRAFGENIARGQATQEQALQGWTNSPGHHANNINPAFEDFALAKSGTGPSAHWVLVLATER